MLNFVDMDGVIADCSLGLQKHLGLPEIPPTEYHWCKGLVDWSTLGIEFWANLQVYEETLEACKTLPDVRVVTHCFGVDAVIGKRMWLDKHWPGVEMINLADKWLLAGPDRYLWDDYPVQIDNWIEAGGIGQIVRRPWNVTAK